MLTKEKVVESMQNLPSEFSIDDLVDRLILIEKISRGLTQSVNGEVYSTEAARQMLKEWSK